MGKVVFEGGTNGASEVFTVSLGVHRNPSGPICGHPDCNLLAGHRQPHATQDDADEATDIVER